MTEKPQNIRQKPSPPMPLVCYFYGAEDLLLEEAVNAIKAKALSGGLESFNLQVFDRATLDASKIVAAAQTLPAFSEKRVVIVKDAEAIKSKDEEGVKSKNEEIFCEYLKNPSPGTCLIFISGKEKLDKPKSGKESGFMQAVRERGVIRAFNTLNEGELRAWIKKTALSMGKSVTPDATQKLMEFSSGKLRELKAELEKIALFAGEKPEIDANDVDAAGLDCKEEDAFALAKALGEKNLPKAMKMYEKVSAEEPVKILGALSWHMRALFKVKLLSEKRVSFKEISDATRLFGDRLAKYLEMSKSFSVPELASAIRKLQATDTGLKTGQLPQGVLLSKLIIELCGGLRP